MISPCTVNPKQWSQVIFRDDDVWKLCCPRVFLFFFFFLVTSSIHTHSENNIWPNGSKWEQTTWQTFKLEYGFPAATEPNWRILIEVKFKTDSVNKTKLRQTPSKLKDPPRGPRLSLHTHCAKGQTQQISSQGLLHAKLMYTAAFIFNLICKLLALL